MEWPDRGAEIEVMGRVDGQPKRGQQPKAAEKGSQPAAEKGSSLITSETCREKAIKSRSLRATTKIAQEERAGQVNVDDWTVLADLHLGPTQPFE